MNKPVDIDGVRYGSTEGLVREILARGDAWLLDHPGQLHPAEHFLDADGWRDLPTDARDAVLLAVGRAATSLNEFQMLLALLAGKPANPVCLHLIERLESGDIAGAGARAVMEHLATAELSPPAAARLRALLRDRQEWCLLCDALRRSDPDGELPDVTIAHAAEGPMNPSRAFNGAAELVRRPAELLRVAEALRAQPLDVRLEFAEAVRFMSKVWYQLHGPVLRAALEL